MKRKRVKIFLSISLVVLLLVFLGMSWFIGEQVFANSTQVVTNEETQGVGEEFWNIYKMDYDTFKDTYKVESIEVESSLDQHMIPGDYIYAKDSSGKDHDTVILIHGVGGNRLSNYPLAEYFLEQGFNVLTYDQRSSGENQARYTTFGYWEKSDAIDLVKYVDQQAPEQTIGIWGTSFGGATAGQAAGNELFNEAVDFMILDCPVSEMNYMIEVEIEKLNIGLPTGYMLKCGSIVNKQKLGFYFGQSDVPTEIADTDIPVLVINSKTDEVTPYFMGTDIYEAVKNDKKEIWTVDQAKHADIWLEHNVEYRDKVSAFMEQISP